MKKEKKDVASQVRSDVTLLEENKQLKEKCAALVSSGEEMGKEIATLKKSNAGLKGHNCILNRKLTDAEEEVARLKALCREGDELNESRIAMLNEKERVIKGLQEQVNRLSKINEKIASEAEETKKELDALRNKKPWYKKIF